ncbi:endonuclease [Mycoplasmopsis mucosicanis]|uniref:endonuclease n=1 Tax=Mycoplasmopsis mucosicanis TaxID=458208 RepID=UPI0022A690B2|nr:endonuclease [Mycoplasmopsis mucosicanis]
MKGDELFKAVYKNQQKYVSELRSKSSYSNLYNIYSKAFIDKYYEKDGTILDIYSEVADGNDPYEFPVGYYDGSGSKGHLNKKSNGEGFKYNREHMIPQSWFEKVEPTKFDAHFVWPSDKKVNEWRGNNPHFNVQSPTKTSLNGTKIGKKYTEPVNIFKGDTARAYFYFQITHKNAIHGKSKEVFKKAYPYFSDQFLNVYKEWADFDPVDIIEVDRNNIIAEYEGGLRNPFIDYPELIDLIWGDSSKTFVNKGVLKIVENVS